MDRKSAKIPIVRLLEKIDIKPGQCWEWKGTLSPGGYGVIRIAKEKRTVLVHRYFYSFVLGFVINAIIRNVLIPIICILEMPIQMYMT
jgi:hypothetical protein